MRAAEFDRLFAETLIRQERVSATALRLWLSGGAAVTSWMRDLAARETECCSFFRFTVAPRPGAVVLDIEVPPVHVRVLDAIESRLPDAALDGTSS